MELKDFIKLNPKEVRRDKGLMQLYVKFYEAAFFLTPSCVGCSFKSGFKKLIKYANNSNKTIKLVEKTKVMGTKTFIIKNQYKLKILSYKKDGKVYRKYANNIDEDFARELVNAGKSEVFAKLPQMKKESKKEEVLTNQDSGIENMDYRSELLPLYNEIKDRTGKEGKGKSKNDIIEFLKENGY